MPAKQYSIMLVDDEKDILDALYDTFIDKYTIYKANCAEEALKILNENPIDLIISDQRMPGITGVELFGQVEESHPQVGKILLTGYSDLNAVVDAINKGSVDKYLTKPWNDDEIIHIVLEVLNARLKQAIEDRKLIESQLIQNAKMASLGELVAGIAHELNNPLSFINANLGNLKKFFLKILGLIEAYDQMDIPSKAKEEVEKKKAAIKFDYLQKRIGEMLERSSIGADRMRKIIQDLKIFSRLDAAEFAEADINGAIDTTLNIMYNEYKNRIEIKKEFGDLPPVKCYVARLNQVFMNLLINACQVIEGNGEIRIRTGSENGMVKIQISDTGGGIPENVIERIFDPFFTTKPVGQGTGLGLSISHGIIKQHNGEISAESTLGKGTMFTVKIPVNPKSPIKEDLHVQDIPALNAGSL